MNIMRCAIGRIPSLHAHERMIIHQALRNEKDFFNLTLSEIALRIGRQLKKTYDFQPDKIWSMACNDVKYCSEHQIRIISITDVDYPPLLREIAHPPFLLFVRGELPMVHVPMLAVIGTRYPSLSAIEATRALAHDAASENIPIVSGLASGIDGEAQRGVLEAGGITVGVLGTGIDVIYPKMHAGIAKKIIQCHGAIISEYPPNTNTQKYHFSQRNRIISGLCRACVVIEAPEKSGTMITVNYALEQGRDVWVHYAGLHSGVGDGTLKLAHEGAQVMRNLQDLLHDWQ